jgi:hypothetical protein
MRQLTTTVSRSGIFVVDVSLIITDTDHAGGRVVWIHLFHTGVNRMAGIVFIRRPRLCSFLPHRLQRAAPGDDLVEHGVDGLLLLGSRLEDAEVLEIGEE